jgi:hypothetical protein
MALWKSWKREVEGEIKEEGIWGWGVNLEISKNYFVSLCVDCKVYILILYISNFLV